MTREPVGSTGGGRHAPMMTPDDEPPSDSHWCKATGARVYVSKLDCPYCSVDDEDDGGDDQ